MKTATSNKSGKVSPTKAVKGFSELVETGSKYLPENRSEQAENILADLRKDLSTGEDLPNLKELEHALHLAICDSAKIKIEAFTKGHGLENFTTSIGSVPTENELGGGGFSFINALALEALPEHVAEYAKELFLKQDISVYRNVTDRLVKEFKILERTKFWDAESPVVYQLAADFLTRDSIPLEPYVVQKLSTPKSFVNQLQRWDKFLEDPKQRLRAAKAHFSSMKRGFHCYEEFGNDVPVYVPKREHAMIPIPLGIEAFGHEFSVIYSKQNGHYALVGRPEVLKKLVDTFPKLPDLDPEKRLIMGAASNSSYLLTSRTEVRKAIRALRKDGQTKFVKFGDELIPPLPFEDRFRDLNSRKFFGTNYKDPLSIVRIDSTDLRIQTIIDSPQPESTNSTLYITFKDPNNVYRSAESELDRKIDYKEWIGLGGKTGIVTEAQILLWNNGRFLVIPRDPPLLPARSIETEARPIIHGFVSLTSPSDWQILTESPYINKHSGIYPENKIELNFDSIPELKIGVPINVNRLVKGFDPRLKKMGFPRERGTEFNCLTDFKKFVIPYTRKPTQKEFEKAVFGPIRAFQRIPKDDWANAVLPLEGELLKDIYIQGREVVFESHSGSIARAANAESEEETPGKSRRPVKNFNCFVGPRDSVIAIDKWQLSQCRTKEQQEFYVIDSPVRENATYLATDEWAAERIARHFASGGARVEVLGWVGECIDRVIKNRSRDEWTNEIFEKAEAYFALN